MALLRSNTFEGGTNGTTISAANSGGVSGDAVSSVTIGTSCTLTFDNAQAAHGTLSQKATTPATARTAYSVWTGLGGGSSNVWFRTYMYMTALPSTQGNPLEVRTSAAALSCNVRITTAGKIQCLIAAGTSVTALNGTTVIPVNQWVRFEWRVLSSTTAGEMEWRLYTSADSSSITETLSATGLVLGADTDGLRFGITSAMASQSLWLDDVAISTTTWLGSSVGGTTYPKAGFGKEHG